jgi:hypothetical protein
LPWIKQLERSKEITLMKNAFIILLALPLMPNYFLLMQKTENYVKILEITEELTSEKA